MSGTERAGRSPALAKQRMSLSEPDRIIVRGKDLCREVLGELDFPSFLFLEIVGRPPSVVETRMLNAVLVAIAEHGITPTSLSARLTYLGAPDSIQGAIAAGILGTGDVLLGAVEGCARLLQEAVTAQDTEEHLRQAVGRLRSSRERVPGLGHHLHKPLDPRSVRLFEMADRAGLRETHRRAAELLQRIAEEVLQRELPINADGAVAAVLSDIGFDWRLARGFAVVARAGGLLGHLADEMRQPIARAVWALAEEGIGYEDPEAAF